MSTVSLNARLSPRGRGPHVLAAVACEVVFDEIEERLVNLFDAEADQLVACVAWLKAQRLRDAMARAPRGARVVVQSEKHLQTMENLDVRKVGVHARGARQASERSLMHHKFCVGLRDGVPRFVAMGSYNYTGHSRRNLESVVILRDEAAAQHFHDEFDRVWALGRAVQRSRGRKRRRD